MSCESSVRESMRTDFILPVGSFLFLFITARQPDRRHRAPCSVSFTVSLWGPVPSMLQINTRPYKQFMIVQPVLQNSSSFLLFFFSYGSAYKNKGPGNDLCVYRSPVLCFFIYLITSGNCHLAFKLPDYSVLFKFYLYDGLSFFQSLDFSAV